MWEHNAEVNDLTWTKNNPLFGGSTTEHPRLVSCSDDRSVRVWDPNTHCSTAVLNPFSHRSATMRSVYVSQEHLYVGGSDGTVYVYSVDGSTRSLRNREKKRVGLELIYPLETELKSGDDVIGAMCIAHERTEQSRLFVTSWSGVVYVWKIPKEDLEYVLIHEIRHHSRRINNILITRAHFLTCSDDGTIRYYGLCHGDQYEKALERVVDCGSRVKCIHVTPGDPGVVVAGLADGRVLVYELGNIM
jgi:WD40 repeat protein